MFPVIVTAKQLHNCQKEESPRRHPVFSKSDRGKSTFTRKINERISGFKNSTLPPEPLKLWLFSHHFISGIPGRKGQGRRQNGDKVNSTHKSPTPQPKVPGEESMSGA